MIFVYEFFDKYENLWDTYLNLVIWNGFFFVLENLLVVIVVIRYLILVE